MNDEATPKHVVLVIDDEIQIRRLLRITLEANRYKVIDAASGKEGLVEAATRRPDIVILDLGLPDMAFLLTDVVVVFDHLRHQIVLITNISCDEEPDLADDEESLRQTVDTTGRARDSSPRRDSE